MSKRSEQTFPKGDIQTEKKEKARCSMLFVTRELQIKTIRYHYTLAGIVKNPEIAL